MKAVEARGSRREDKICKKEERIQVLLASFQGASYIREQLDSILGQTVPDIQILVSDDGSTDGTREILKRYEEQYPGRVVCQHRTEAGAYGNREGRIPAPAMNFFWLMSQADGDYVLLSDQDDVWDLKKVEKLLEKMREIEKDGLPALVFSDMEVTDSRLEKISSSFFTYSRCKPRRLSLAELLVENPVTGGALMMNRPLVELASRIPQACFMHDWWIALCASCFGRIVCVPEPLSRYRQHGGNSLGARKAGSLKDLRERQSRKMQVEDNYHRIFWQAQAFWKMFGKKLQPRERKILKAFLALPGRTPAGRFLGILKYGFYKSSWFYTLAQCFTMPR